MLKENPVVKHRPSKVSKSKTLNDYNITRDESSAFQKIAKLPDDLFEEQISIAKEETNKRIELTTAKMLQAAKQYVLDKIRTDESNKIKTVNINENTINGDSLEVLKTLDDGCIDIVITDPPYGINYQSNRSKYTDSITKKRFVK